MSWVNWGPREVLLGVGVFLALLLTVGGLVAGIGSALGADQDSLAVMIAGQAVVAAIFIGTVFGCAAPGARGPAEPGRLGLRRFRPSALGWMAVGYLAYWAFAIGFALLVTSPDQEDIARDLGAGAGTLGTVASGLLVIVAAPISEELFFRGFMFGGIRSRLDFLPAALVTATIFGLSHSPTGITAVPQLAVLGLILAWLYEKTGSLWPSILVHMTNNAIAFTVLVAIVR